MFSLLILIIINVHVAEILAIKHLTLSKMKNSLFFFEYILIFLKEF